MGDSHEKSPINMSPFVAQRLPRVTKTGLSPQAPANTTTTYRMVMIVLLLITVLVSGGRGFSWNSSDDALWAFSCSFPGNAIGYRVVKGELCSGKCYEIKAPRICTHFTYTDSTKNCSFYHNPKVVTSDAIAAGYKYDVCGIMWRSFVGRPSPRPHVDRVEEVWLWAGPLLGAVATIVGALLTLIWARHERARHQTTIANNNVPQQSYSNMDNYSSLDTYPTRADQRVDAV